MSTLIFYEKPGCANNARQKRLLLDAGHELVVRDLLSEPWTAQRLQEFFMPQKNALTILPAFDVTLPSNNQSVIACGGGLSTPFAQHTHVTRRLRDARFEQKAEA